MWTMENRSRYERRGLRYPTDMTDAEWSLIAGLIPPAKRGGNAQRVKLREVVNARALVSHHDAATREVRFNSRFAAFAGYWGFRPRACAHYRARTKGKDERGVGYVKRNAIAGHRFGAWAEMEAHLARWTREVAEVRLHGSTGEAPIERFRRDEAAALRPLNGRPPFRQIRELVRAVHSDARSVAIHTG